MNSQARMKPAASKPIFKHIASLPAFNIREASRSNGRKTSKQKRKDRGGTYTPIPGNRPTPNSKSKQLLPSKRSTKKGKSVHGKKPSLMLKSVNLPHQFAYYGQDSQKEDKIRSSCFLSTHSKDSLGKMLASTRHNLDSERTVSRHQPRPAVQPSSPLKALLQRTRIVLDKYRLKCSQLQKSNRQLKQQLQHYRG